MLGPWTRLPRPKLRERLGGSCSASSRGPRLLRAAPLPPDRRLRRGDRDLDWSGRTHRAIPPLRPDRAPGVPYLAPAASRAGSGVGRRGPGCARGSGCGSTRRRDRHRECHPLHVPPGSGQPDRGGLAHPPTPQGDPGDDPRGRLHLRPHRHGLRQRRLRAATGVRESLLRPGRRPWLARLRVLQLHHHGHRRLRGPLARPRPARGLSPSSKP